MRDDVLALATNIAAAPLAPPPARTIFEPSTPASNEFGHNGHSVHTATLEQAEPAIEPGPSPQIEEEPRAPHDAALESLVRPLIESAPPALIATAEPPSSQPTPDAPTPPAGLSEAMELQASLLIDAMESRTEAEQAEIRSIVTSFQQQNNTALLPAPRQVVTAPAPPSQQWMRTPRPKIAPVAPTELQPSDLMFGLQIAPLAGPCIPQDLRNLVEAQHPARHRPGRKKAALPGWTVSFLVALTLFLGVGSLLQYWAANRDNKTSPPATAAAVEPSSPAPARGPSSSKTIEVTGLRVLPGPDRPRLDFIVVNHSATPVSGAGLKIEVRSSSSPGGGSPLFTISTTIASLGPYQSREFRAELEPGMRASDIPDWQSLRADARLATQQ